MNLLGALHGITALLLISALLGIEEVGVPLPLLPGDLLLIAAGVLITNGSFSAWAFMPVAFAAMLAGAVGGYAWSRALGRGAVTRLGARLGAGAAVERIASRMAGAGPGGVFACRMLPGLRVYTNLAAGALGVRLRTFVLGALPSLLIWVGGFTVLGMLVGVPAERLLRGVMQQVLTGAAVVVLAVVAVLLIRRIPSGQRQDVLVQGSRRVRYALAMGLDLLCVGAVASALSRALAALAIGPDGIVDLELLLIATTAVYVGATRVSAGATAGEGLLGVGYARPRRRDR